MEPQSETVWRQGDRYHIPRLAYINKMDITGADFFHCIDMMKSRLKANAIPIQLPIGKEENFKGIIDLVKQKAYYYIDDLGNVIEETDIPADMEDLVKEHRGRLIEAIAEYDEELMVKYLEDEDISEDEIKSAIRKATINVAIIPVTCGSSYKNKGVRSSLMRLLTICLHPLIFRR